MGKDNKCIECIIAIVFAIAAASFGLSIYVFVECRKDNPNDSGELAVKEMIETQVANLTEKSKLEREDTNRTISQLNNEVTQLKHDYMELLSETRALNKTINYTTSATVQRALNELNNVKETQKDIQKKLEGLSHLNDTAEDHLKLRKEVKNLAVEVNRNITHIEDNLKDNRQEWERALDNKTSGIKTDILALQNRLDKLENSTTTTNGVGVLRLTKPAPEKVDANI